MSCQLRGRHLKVKNNYYHITYYDYFALSKRKMVGYTTLGDEVKYTNTEYDQISLKKKKSKALGTQIFLVQKHCFIMGYFEKYFI